MAEITIAAVCVINMEDSHAQPMEALRDQIFVTTDIILFHVAPNSSKLMTTCVLFFIGMLKVLPGQHIKIRKKKS